VRRIPHQEGNACKLFIPIVS